MYINNLIFGLNGTKLLDEEKDFIKSINPLGFILFKRNCETKEQIQSLTETLRGLTGHTETLILIDQEGGRVARLQPPDFRKTLPAKVFGDIAKLNLEKAKEAVYINHLLIGRELRDLGINVDCAPVADIFYDFANGVIGDRSFGEDPYLVSELCKIADLGLRDAGIQSIFKHIPGHGRADKDSHFALPVVKDSLTLLHTTDFLVFNNLSFLKFAMTAHVIYQCIDELQPVTISLKAIEFIRKELSFKGLIITDDLSMKALSGTVYDNARLATEAKCDILLHCNGKIEEMKEVAKAATPLTNEQLEKIYNLNCFFDFEPYNPSLFSKTNNDLEDKLKDIIYA